jgi:hypothetical protein
MSGIFKVIQGLVNLVNSNGDEIDSTDDLLNSSKKRLDVNTGAETINNNGNQSIRVVVTEPTPADQPGPTNIFLSNTTITEDLSPGGLVGTLATENGLAPFTYTITNDPDSKFQIANGNELQLAAGVDFDVAQFHNVTIEVEDTNLNTFEKTFLITVTSVADSDKELLANGIDEFAEGLRFVEMNGDNSFTIGFWFTPLRSDGDEYLISWQNSGGATERGIGVFYDGSGRIHFEICDNKGGGEFLQVRLNSTVGLNERAWIFIEYDGSRTASGVDIRKDNGGTPNTTLSDTLTGGSDIDSSRSVVRYMANGRATSYAQARIDNFMFFNKVLTTSERDEIYNGGDVLTDLTATAAIGNNISHVAIDSNDVYPTLIDKRGIANWTMNGNMSQANIVDLL